MASVTYVSNDEAAETIRPILEGLEKKLGAVPNVYRAMAHSPELFEAFLGLNRALSKTKLDGKLRELAYIKASELNDCAYCLHYHRSAGRKAGLTDRQIDETADFESSDAYDALQKDVLRYTGQVTRQINAEAELVERLRRSLDDRELMELAMAVGIANFTNRVTETLKLELP